MSREQEALWLDDLFCDGQSMYGESWACRVTGNLDVDAVEWAIGQIVARHEVLRTRLTERAGEPVQIVGATESVRLAQLSCSPEDLPGALSRVVAEPLDLDETPIRPWLVRLSPTEAVLVVQLHHAVVDDWALNIFQRELMHLYRSRLLGRPPGLEPLPVQAGEFAVAQRAQELDPADIEYWRERVRAAPRSFPLPPDRPGSADPPHRAERYVLTVDPELGRAVRAAGRVLRTTPFTVFAAAMAALLWQYGESDEVIFGTPVSLRGTAAVDDMIGYLCNLLPLRLTVSPSTSFRALANATRAEVLGAMAHRSVPFSHLVRMSGRKADDGLPLLCDVFLVVDDMTWEPLALPGLAVERIYIPPVRAKCALIISLVAGEDGGYTGYCDYDADAYEASTVARVAGRYAALLAKCVAAPDETVGHLTGLPGTSAAHPRSTALSTSSPGGT
ncbi:condensation domain-containing protein [Micromonospora sp. NPDC005298]|uniref:condensation domain-containing protein n=1 Tax=Micromonospora sp. NPDC005298 TaxID=3156873 RepID=UPI0033A6EC48